MTLCARTFSRNCVASRLGRVSASGQQGSPDATDRTLRREDSAQQGVSSLHGKIKIGRPRENKKQTMEIDKSLRAAQDMNDANMRMWRNKQKHRRKETTHGMKFATFQPSKNAAQTTLCKQPELLSQVRCEELVTNTENECLQDPQKR